MRVIAGKAKGTRLKTLEGLDVRPTTDRVKEGMFSSIQFQIHAAKVLDLFAGSGQLGIEALSRGAEHVTFVDQSAKSLNIVKENLEKTRFLEKSVLYQKSAEQFIASCPPDSFDLIFLDPPYRKQILQNIIPDLSRLLRPDGKIIAEHEINCTLQQEISDLILQKNYFYGKIIVSVFSKNKTKEET